MNPDIGAAAAADSAVDAVTQERLESGRAVGSAVIKGPCWNIPESIAREDVIPKALDNEDFMIEQGYQVVEHFGADADILGPAEQNLKAVAAGTLKMRQAPGPGNALGRVKFMFPNQHSVYLHDTPADRLLAEAERDFSHGCIRVERPVDLASFVFENRTDWTKKRIRETMNDDRHEIVTLHAPVDVFIVYMTASVDSEGRAVFSRTSMTVIPGSRASFRPPPEG